MWLNICFHRNELATVNAWHASQISTAAAISFDGMGYLFVEQLSSITEFSSQFRRMIITVRPNDESDGLVLYAYDSTVSPLRLFACNYVHANVTFDADQSLYGDIFSSWKA